MSGTAAVRSLVGFAGRCARHWWPQVATLAAASGIVTATIAGALGVGDAMHRGLLHVAHGRLGRIDAAVIADQPFRADLAGELAACLTTGPVAPAVVPAMILEMAIEAPPSGHRGRVAARATLLACDDLAMLGFAPPPRLAADEVAINAALAETLGVTGGEPLVLRLAVRSDVPADSPLGRRSMESMSRRLRLAAVLPRGSLGDFSLQPTQVTSGLAVTSLAVAQSILREEGAANALLCVAGSAARTTANDALAQQLAHCVRPQLADYGLAVEGVAATNDSPASLRLVSRSLVLDRPIDRAAADVLGPRGGRPSLVFLANALQPVGGKASIPYSTIVGLDSTTHPAGAVVDGDDHQLPLPGPDEIIIDRWMAEDLAAQGSPVAIGDMLDITTFLPETLHGRVEEATHRLRISGIAAMRGAAVARSLVPEVEGVTDEQSIADWDPPFPFDRRRVRTTPPDDQDDRYWKEYGATPKAFVSLATARAIAGSRFGETTAWHVPTAAVENDESLRVELAAALQPESLGFRILPLVAQAEAAARGSTPFGALFIGLSLVVVAAGLLLEWLLFHLLVSAHRREAGMLVAIGWPARRLAHLLLMVGAIAVVGGGILGLIVAPIWSAALLAWLGQSWDAAVATGSRQVFGAAVPRLAAMWPGMAAAAAVSLAAVWWAARRAAGSQPWPLLRGEAPLQWQGRVRAHTVVRSLGQLARRGLAYRRSRTLSVIAIVALAEFLIVVVSAFALRPPERAGERGSPTGGWTHIASFGEPNGIDPADPDVAATLGLSDPERDVLAACTIERIRSNGGDDASCTNLYAAMRPTVFGVGPAFVRRGGFRFVGHAPLEAGATNPWTLLQADPGREGSIPAILDQATAQWALKLGGVGSLFTLPTDDGGSTPPLRIVGLLEPGILQGAVIISEHNFTRLLPRRSGYALALVDASAVPAQSREAAPRAVAAAWADVGVSVQSSVDRLQSLYAVQNTFLSGFQMLGSLGLLLGTLGVAAVQMQGVFERLGALAVLRSIGFTIGRVRGLIVLETVMLVGTGLLAGAALGCLALLPLLVAGRATVPWGWLAVSALLTLAAASGAGMIAARDSMIPVRPSAE
jgi:putative ABC transport system permease protein